MVSVLHGHLGSFLVGDKAREKSAMLSCSCTRSSRFLLRNRWTRPIIERIAIPHQIRILRSLSVLGDVGMFPGRSKSLTGTVGFSIASRTGFSFESVGSATGSGSSGSITPASLGAESVVGMAISDPISSSEV